MSGYTAPYVSASGLHLPSYQDILSDLVQQLLGLYPTAYLGTINPDGSVTLNNDSSDAQHIVIFALKIYDCLNTLQLTYNNMSPITAVGTGLDLIIKTNGMERNKASYSTCIVTITGVPGAIIVNGVVQDINGINWNLPAVVSIGSSGTISIAAQCSVAGAINAAEDTLTTIVNQQNGWVSVTNANPAVAGVPSEVDSKVKTRQAVSVALPSLTRLAGTIGALASLSGVTRLLVLENPTGSTSDGTTIYGGGSTLPNLILLPSGLPPHSITCMVEGDTDINIGNIIYLNKGPGCWTNGSTAVNVIDPNYGTIIPTNFNRPTYIPIFVTLNITRKTGYVAPATTLAIQAAVADYLNSLGWWQNVEIGGIVAAAMSATPNLAIPLFSVNIATSVAGTSLGSQSNSDITIAYNEIAQGITGTPGVNWRGAYNGSTAYLLGDGVSYGSPTVLYQAIENTTGNLPINATYWQTVSNGVMGNIVINVT